MEVKQAIEVALTVLDRAISQNPDNKAELEQAYDTLANYLTVIV